MAAVARLAVPNNVSISRRSTLWYVGETGCTMFVLIGGAGLYQCIYASSHCAYAVCCKIYRACSVDVVVERECILLTPLISVP